jgi:arsenate reductase-like glutaredoxin family protein
MTQADSIREFFLVNKSGTTRDVMKWLDDNNIPYNSIKTVSGHLSKMYSRQELKREGSSKEYIYYI